MEKKVLSLDSKMLSNSRLVKNVCSLFLCFYLIQIIVCSVVMIILNQEYNRNSVNIEISGPTPWYISAIPVAGFLSTVVDYLERDRTVIVSYKQWIHSTMSDDVSPIQWGELKVFENETNIIFYEDSPEYYLLKVRKDNGDVNFRLSF